MPILSKHRELNDYFLQNLLLCKDPFQEILSHPIIFKYASE